MQFVFVIPLVNYLIEFWVLRGALSPSFFKNVPSTRPVSTYDILIFLVVWNTRTSSQAGKASFSALVRRFCLSTNIVRKLETDSSSMDRYPSASMKRCLMIEHCADAESWWGSFSRRKFNKHNNFTLEITVFVNHGSKGRGKLCTHSENIIWTVNYARRLTTMTHYFQDLLVAIKFELIQKTPKHRITS